VAAQGAPSAIDRRAANASRVVVLPQGNSKAFSNEMDTGSHEENATKHKLARLQAA
jgi:hypothetical protein